MPARVAGHLDDPPDRPARGDRQPVGGQVFLERLVDEGERVGAAGFEQARHLRRRGEVALGLRLGLVPRHVGVVDEHVDQLLVQRAAVQGQPARLPVHPVGHRRPDPLGLLQVGLAAQRKAGDVAGLVPAPQERVDRHLVELHAPLGKLDLALLD